MLNCRPGLGKGIPDSLGDVMREHRPPIASADLPSQLPSGLVSERMSLVWGLALDKEKSPPTLVASCILEVEVVMRGYCLRKMSNLLILSIGC